ncbi:5-oxoprolinase subunit B family protein [Pseudogemmobacter faecipullorum]|uniref:Allophanate hydrolase subunit 1 n=1 Tax=Pseudogemmobacter faecipullorum TaxID=2755041 RepID=A0ABS8CJJ6_9RHOB|nr:allophanate hydrolase subunit 1 [Pseudogemmobacter faecipullorum]MCB5409540.1 allophanate hydrolase subunit 1 [Pseudogemmobacter faecipullorum]
MQPGFPRFRAIAERGLLVEFGEAISEEINAQVTRLDRALAASPPAGFCEAVPAYASLLICFDPLLTDHETMRAAASGLLSHPAPPPGSGQIHDIAVCYEGAFAPDLAEVAQLTGLGPEAVIASHLAGSYRVFMYGFAPGYAYLAGVPEAIRLPRKPAAIRDIPAGSLLIAGQQCIVSTLKMPTGWWVIGRSPTRILTGRPDRPFLFEPGDQLRFHRISRAEFGPADG